MRFTLLTLMLTTLVASKLIVMEVEDLRKMMQKNRGHKGWFSSSEPTPEPETSPEIDLAKSLPTPQTEEEEYEQEEQATEGIDDQTSEDNDEDDPDADKSENEVDVDNLGFVPEQRGAPVGFQKIHGIEEDLWPALCVTKNHGLQWGKHDGTQAFFTFGKHSVHCGSDGELFDRSDLEEIPYDAENPDCPCPELSAEGRKGKNGVPVIVHSAHGSIPGKALLSEIEEKQAGAKGYFGYDGKGFQGKIVAWLC